jgi:hypothetical protein
MSILLYHQYISHTDKKSENVALNDTIDQMELTRLQSIPFCNSTIYIFIAACRIFPKINHVLGHKVSLNQYKKIKITPCILSDHNTIKQEKKQQKTTKMPGD